MSDLTKKVRQRDGDRGQRGDTEDSGEKEERVVDIYESADHFISGPQLNMRDNTAGRHSQGQRSKTVRTLIVVVAVCLGMLCLVLLGVNIGQALHYNSVNNNLTLKGKQLETDYNNLTLERNQLKIDYNNLILERNKLKKDAERVKSCPSGWKKFGCSCYYNSTESKTWKQSTEECQKKGAHLVIIDSKEEQDFIRELIQGPWPLWIGLKKTKSEWTWLDGTPLTTQYWADGQPDNKEEDESCAFYFYPSGGRWYNGGCLQKKSRICEK